MRNILELPRLSLKERDRRWTAVRKEMDARGLDCLVLWGWPLMWDFCIANARYLCPVGGNAEFNVLVFPRDGEPTSFVLMPTFLDGWRSAQDWVGDIRARKSTWADSVAARLKELKLDKGRIGMDGLAGPLDPDGWLPHSVYVRLQELLPGAALELARGRHPERMRIGMAVAGPQKQSRLFATLGNHRLHHVAVDLALPDAGLRGVAARRQHQVADLGGLGEDVEFLVALDGAHLLQHIVERDERGARQQLLQPHIDAVR